MHDLTNCHRDHHTLRVSLWDLAGWVDQQLDTDADRQYIAEHMTAVLAALLARETPPPRPF
jgi:cobalamin biosynthesis Mg chelatase CobN